MQRSMTLFIISVSGLFLISAAAAGDLEDVKAAQKAHFEAYNDSDAEAVAQYVLPEMTSFFAGGGLLSEGFDKTKLKAGFDAGLKFSRELQHLEAKIHNNIALITGYWSGTVKLLDGTTLKGPMRHTALWIKREGKWKLVHGHNSPLKED